MIFPSRLSTERESQPTDIVQPIFNLALSLKPLTPLPKPAATSEPKGYLTAATRADIRQISSHYLADDVQAFRILAVELDMDVQMRLA